MVPSALTVMVPLLGAPVVGTLTFRLPVAPKGESLASTLVVTGVPADVAVVSSCACRQCVPDTATLPESAEFELKLV